MNELENKPEATKSSSSSETRDLAELMEALAKENRKYMADFAEVMRLEHEFDERLDLRTTHIVRISLLALVIMGSAMMFLILTLTSNMNDITQHMNTMSKNMASMSTDMSTMNKSMAGMHNDFDQVTTDMHGMHRQFWLMNGQMNDMTRDVNAMSSPMKIFPFRPR